MERELEEKLDAMAMVLREIRDEQRQLWNLLEAALDPDQEKRKALVQAQRAANRARGAKGPSTSTTAGQDPSR